MAQHEDTYSEDNNSAWHAAKWQERRQALQWIYIRIVKTTVTVFEDPVTYERWTDTAVNNWSYYFDLKYNYPAIYMRDGKYILEVRSDYQSIQGSRCISRGDSGYVENDSISNHVEWLRFVFSSLDSPPEEVYKNGDQVFTFYRYPSSPSYYEKYEDYGIVLDGEQDEVFMGGYYTEIPTAAAWYPDGNNDNRLRNNFLPYQIPLNGSDRPRPMWYLDPYRRILNGLIPRPLISTEGIVPFERPEPICLYDVHEPQDGFTSNGEAILMPYECTSIKEDAGRWDVSLKHPIDKYGKWTYIAGQNIIKVNGQLFRIDQTEIVSQANGEYISAHANHITYDLKDFWIKDADFTVNDGYSYIGELWSHRITDFPNQQHMIGDYEFTITSDLQGTKYVKFTDQSYIEALYGGDNSMLNQYGGKLYRNNFYMSINQSLEYAPEGNAFAIRYGTNMTKINFKIDMSGWITNLVTVDNLGNLYGQWYDTAGGEWICHHHKTKRIHFTYEDLGDSAKNMERLIADGDAYWATVATPQISIDIGVANIKNDPLYSEFLNLQNYDVGYQGIIYVEHLGINVQMKIVQMKRDELTGNVLSIKLGSVRGSLIRQTVLSQTIVAPDSAEFATSAKAQQLQQELDETNLRLVSANIGSMETFTINALEEYTINQLEGV